MKLSMKGRYGIHAMFDLAENYGSTTPLKAIAERQRIPEAYLEQMMGQLRRADLVTAARGAQGGYALNKPPEDITVGIVFRALEGDLAPFDCLEDSVCDKSCGCATQIVFRKVSDAINHTVDAITLKDMLYSQAQLEAQLR